MLDLVLLALKQLDEQCAARVLAYSRSNTVGDGQDCRPQAGSFDFSTSLTSVTTSSRSTAFVMS
jgi:hypothetical protein